MATLQARLSELMREHGEDQSSLARKIGCTPAAINQILSGKTQRSRLLPDIAEHYDVSLGFLTGKSSDRGPAEAGGREISVEERRLISLAQRLDAKDRELVIMLVERLLGAVRSSVGPDTLHDRQLGYRSG